LLISKTPLFQVYIGINFMDIKKLPLQIGPQR